MADQGTSRSGSTDTVAVLTAAQKLAAGLAVAKRERDLLESAAREFLQLFRTDYAGMLIAQPDGFGRVVGEYPAMAKLDGLSLSPDVRLISEHCAKNLLTMVDSVSGSVLLSQKARESILQAKLNSLVLLPMGSQQGRWLGAVILGFNHDLTLSSGAVETAASLAQQLGGLVITARQIERTNRQVEQFSALLALTEHMGHIESEDDLAYEIAKVIPSILPVKQFAVLRGSPYGRTLDLAARWENGHAQKIHRDQPVLIDTTNTILSLLNDGDAIIDVTDFSESKPPLQGMLQVPTSSGLASVLRLGREAIGAIVVEAENANSYQDTDKIIFTQLVAQMNNAFTRLNASFGLMRAATGSNAVNTVSEKMQGETSAQGVLNSGTLATLRVLNAKRVSIQLGGADTLTDGTNQGYSNGNGAESTGGNNS